MLSQICNSLRRAALSHLPPSNRLKALGEKKTVELEKFKGGKKTNPVVEEGMWGESVGKGGRRPGGTPLINLEQGGSEGAGG